MADIIRWDQGYHWDDGNHYDQPPLLSSLPLKRTKRKTMGDFIPPAKGDYRIWLLNLKTELTALGTTFGATAADITATNAVIDGQIARIDTYETKKSDADFALQTRDTGRTTTDANLRERIGDWKRLSGFTPAISDQLRPLGTAPAFDAAN